MRKQIDVLNCPLCGSKSRTFYINKFWGVQCLNPECGCKVCDFTERYLAVEVWNKRTIKIKDFQTSRRIHIKKGCDALE